MAKKTTNLKVLVGENLGERRNVVTSSLGGQKRFLDEITLYEIKSRRRVFEGGEKQIAAWIAIRLLQRAGIRPTDEDKARFDAGHTSTPEKKNSTGGES